MKNTQERIGLVHNDYSNSRHISVPWILSRLVHTFKIHATRSYRGITHGYLCYFIIRQPIQNILGEKWSKIQINLKTRAGA